MATILRVGPISFPYAGRPRDIVRGAIAGAILLAIAGAGMSFGWNLSAYRIGEEDGAGATIRGDWDSRWPLRAAGGVAAGAAAGALAVFVAGAALQERGGAGAVVAVGAVAGMLAFLSLAHAAGRDRVVTIRAHPTTTPDLPPTWQPTFTVRDAPIHLSATIDRRMNYPVAVFLVACGAFAGALAGRGLVGTWPAGHRPAKPAEGPAEAAAPVTPVTSVTPVTPVAPVRPPPHLLKTPSTYAATAARNRVPATTAPTTSAPAMSALPMSPVATSAVVTSAAATTAAATTAPTTSAPAISAPATSVPAMSAAAASPLPQSA